MIFQKNEQDLISYGTGMEDHDKHAHTEKTATYCCVLNIPLHSYNVLGGLKSRAFTLGSRLKSFENTTLTVTV